MTWTHTSNCTAQQDGLCRCFGEDYESDPICICGAPGWACECVQVCPGCHAVGEERCAPDCIDAEIERGHREAIESGNYDRFDPDENDREWGES